MRLIDADALFEHLKREGILFDAPTADVVEVVRCKDCKRWKNKHLCEAWSRYGTIETKADQFCSYGEKNNEIRNNRTDV